MTPVEDPRWSDFLQLLLSDKGGPTFSPEVFKFENEVKTSRFIHGSAPVRQLLIEWLRLLPTSTYDEEESNQYREKGNQHFKDSTNVGQAVLLYTKAIIAAPSNTQSLALAHGNRAAALFKMGEFEAAYNDCQCALDINHPKPNIIVQRQATIASSMKDAAKLRECIDQMENIHLADKIVEYRKELDKIDATINIADPTSSNNRSIPERKQKILKSALNGRYVVAGEPISSNEIIMTEEAVAFVPIFNEVDFRSVCDNCADNDIVPFPCNSCQGAFYCSPCCREQHSSIHSTECKAYQIHLFHQVGIAYLAFRCLLVTFDRLLEELKMQNKQSAEQLWPCILQTARDGELMGLCTNFEAIEDENIVRYALTASLLCCYLSDQSPFFENTRTARHELMNSESEWEIVVAALLLRLTNQMICNAHNVEGIIVRKPFIASTYPAGCVFESIDVGTLFSAIYPRVSLYNHSCKPNFRNRFDRTRLGVVAKSNLNTGDEIFNSYGVNSRTQVRNERRAALREQYGFTCYCEECQKDGDENYFQYNHIICSAHNCGTHYITNSENVCPKCRTKFDEKFNANISDCVDLMDESVYKYKFLYDLYVKIDTYMPRRTKMRFSIAHQILACFSRCKDLSVRQNEEVTRLLLRIAVELIEDVEEVEGIGVAFVHSSALLLDIIALRKTSGLEKINIGYDLMRVKEALGILTPRMKCKFEKYFEMYSC